MRQERGRCNDAFRHSRHYDGDRYYNHDGRYLNHGGDADGDYRSSRDNGDDCPAWGSDWRANHYYSTHADHPAFIGFFRGVGIYRGSDVGRVVRPYGGVRANQPIRDVRCNGDFRVFEWGTILGSI